MKNIIKNKKLFYGVLALILVVLFLFIWNNYQIQIQERPVKPIKIPPQISGKCGMENCHGLDITCGPNIPEICDYSYGVRDSCREYASCQKIDGKCQLVKTGQFDSCKSCVEKCETFECAGKCVK